MERHFRKVKKPWGTLWTRPLNTPMKRARAKAAGRRRTRRRGPRRRGRFVQGTGGCWTPELKFHDLDIDDTTVVNNIAQDSCNLIPQGITEKTRIGRKCCIKSIGWRFRWDLKVTSTPAETSDTMRVILYLDKQANGTAPAVTDILESSSYLSFNNLSNKNRFRTLMDRTYVLNSKSGAFDGTNDQFGEDHVVDTFFKRCQIPIEFDDSFADGRLTTIRSNNIGVLLLSRDSVGGFKSKMRLRFSDA